MANGAERTAASPLRRRLIAALLLASPAVAAAQAEVSDREQARRRADMVATVQRLTGAGPFGERRALDRRVLDALGEVPRHRFVPASMRDRAYADTALPIGHGSTISQPLIVAWMTDLLDVRAGQAVLEVGAGSGYQAAVLARLGARVHTVEIVPELARRARATLQAEGYGGVSVRAGDGYRGWPDAAPFDRILVTAGATHVPALLVAQLKPGGRMLIPMGPDDAQRMVLVTKDSRGRTRVRQLTAVAFVPLVEPEGR